MANEYFASVEATLRQEALEAARLKDLHKKIIDDVSGRIRFDDN